jgi:hypothetical protein
LHLNCHARGRTAEENNMTTRGMFRGQLAAICTGAPVRVSVCRCRASKRRTGSAFSNNARWRDDDVAIEGRSKAYTRISYAESRVTFGLCPDCGTTVHYRIDADPGLTAIPVGAFADRDFPAPFPPYYHQSRRSTWVGIGAEPLERFD